ncbi:TonB-dependent receptor plug domain-containing protein [Sinimarinibacterium sp. CAU 1509]|uniref:TonB-dependent receptor plug domain-containing protein n=1 Tax=Sinimarinibacterium sp. CAU 1509 TaxID=2562283 RepID=UPI00200ADF12|nr:TonB-dependent receptor [Sinimarinibacterium sp. CAU 1509]
MPLGHWPSAFSRGTFAALAAAMIAAPGVASADALPLQTAASGDLTQLSLEDLLNIEVTSVSKRAEPLSDAAAAITVLTGEEIRRSGVRSIAEALRMVPGLDVARTSAQGYAVSARGFNSSSADKLEILLDGRSVYTPLFSGVFWDSLDTFLPDIDRIEVIRGPGAALWGANAVNGVINIVTRSSEQTQDTRIIASGGLEQRGAVGVRSGTRLGDQAWLRLYGIAKEIDRSRRADNTEVEDGGRHQQFGFRSDWNVSTQDQLTISGDYYGGEFRANGAASAAAVGLDVNGGNLGAHWTHSGSHGVQTSAQMYYDHSERRQPTTYAETRDTLSLEMQQGRALTSSQYLLYGAGFRTSSDQTGAAPDYAVVWDPSDRTLRTYSAFIQDQITLSPTTVLTLGSKFEHNDFTGFEYQPNLRLGWHAAADVFVWSSLARAVRTPNRLDSDVALYCPPPDGIPGICGPGLIRVGNPNLDAEQLLALDGGLRWTVSQAVSMDLALFANRYSRLKSTERDTPVGRYANLLEGKSFGGELSLNWQVAEDVRIQASYSNLNLNVDPYHGGTDAQTAAQWEGTSPQHQAGLRLSWDPHPDWTVNSFLRYVGQLDAYDVPAYTELSLRTAWRLRPNLELGLVGDNLLSDQHAEFGNAPNRSELERDLMLTLDWTLP